MNEPRPLRESLSAPLAAADAERLWLRIEQQRRERAQVRRAVPAIALGCAAAVAAILLVGRGDRSAPRVAQPAPAATAPATAREPLRWANGAPLSSVQVEPGAPARTLALSDGTRVTLGSGTRLLTRAATRERTELVLDRGRARFELKPQRARRFEVLSAGLRVEVVGTTFTVERAQGEERVSVAVEHGRVRVHGSGLPADGALLEAGRRLDWSAPAQAAAGTPVSAAHDRAAPASAAPVAAVHDQAAPASTAPVSSAHDRAAPAIGSSVAVAHDRAPAPSASAASGGTPSATSAPSVGPAAPPAPSRAPAAAAAGVAAARELPDNPRALLSLADHARATGRPEQAAAALAHLVARHPKSAHAPLAALTLGRLQLDALHEPTAAARSLRRALALGLPRALREDALARLVQAHAEAGDGASARSAASEYRARFPRGRWRASVDVWSAAER